jgi:transposase
MEGIRLLQQGVHQSEVARRVKASHRSVGRWAKAYAEQGRNGLRKAGRAGRKPLEWGGLEAVGARPAQRTRSVGL